VRSVAGAFCACLAIRQPTLRLRVVENDHPRDRVAYGNAPRPRPTAQGSRSWSDQPAPRTGRRVHASPLLSM
jgi:hypothetical protein